LIQFLSLLLFSFLSTGCAVAKEDAPTAVGQGEVSAPLNPNTTGDLFRLRYPVKNASEKLVSNNGQGLASLYGTRNTRAVLNGVYYRGGANNIHFIPKRGNMNPLPDKGLENLCKEGFSHAVYLYSDNYESAPKEVKCVTFAGADNTLSYLQISPLAYKDEDMRRLHALIFDHIRDPRLGPIYDHCWNGWHASGYVAATALRQFCGFTGDQAVAYWNVNTDGNNGSNYNRLRDRIRNFQINPEMQLSEEEKTVLCPSPGSLNFTQ
jgi:hypothetical protein